MRSVQRAPRAHRALHLRGRTGAVVFGLFPVFANKDISASNFVSTTNARTIQSVSLILVRKVKGLLRARTVLRDLIATKAAVTFMDLAR